MPLYTKEKPKPKVQKVQSSFAPGDWAENNYADEGSVPFDLF